MEQIAYVDQINENKLLTTNLLLLLNNFKGRKIWRSILVWH